MKGEEIVKGIESSSVLYAEEIIMDERMREIKCPVCGTMREDIEQDAMFVYKCAECGIKVQVPDFEENNFLT